MRKPIFILILLTFCTILKAQEEGVRFPVRLVFTTHYQYHIFGYDPVWRTYPDGSLSRALTYIESHRKEIGEERFALLNCGSHYSDVYQLYPGIGELEHKLLDYAGYVSSLVEDVFEKQGMLFQPVYFPDRSIQFGMEQPEHCIRIGMFEQPETTREEIARTPGLRLAIQAAGRSPEVYKLLNADGDTVTVINTGTTGKFIGVADFFSPGEFTAKTVDISGFPVDADYEEQFRMFSDRIGNYYNTPIVRFARPAGQSGFLLGPTAYTGLFHRFQLETTGADISFFSVPRAPDSIPVGDMSFSGLLRRFRYGNRLTVIELSGEQVRSYLEYAYGLRYHTMRRSTDDLVRMTRDRDGVLQTRTAVYNLDEAAGIRYEVDVSRPAGRRVKIVSMADGSPFGLSKRYRVVLNSHRLESGYLERACGVPGSLLYRSECDLRSELREWLEREGEVTPESLGNWWIVPESFARTAADALREFQE